MNTLTERVSLYRPNKVADGYGGTENGWEWMLTCRAGLRNLRGGEQVQASRLAGLQPAVWTIRASDAARAVTTGWRLTDERRDHDYNITAAVETDDRRFVEITATRGGAV